MIITYDPNMIPNHTTSTKQTPRHDELNPPKGREKLFNAIKRDGKWEEFKKGTLDAATINKYVAECIPLHEQERMAKAALKQSIKQQKKFVQSTSDNLSKFLRT